MKYSPSECIENYKPPMQIHGTTTFEPHNEHGAFWKAGPKLRQKTLFLEPRTTNAQDRNMKFFVGLGVTAGSPLPHTPPSSALCADNS